MANSTHASTRFHFGLGTNSGLRRLRRLLYGGHVLLIFFHGYHLWSIISYFSEWGKIKRKWDASGNPHLQWSGKNDKILN